MGGNAITIVAKYGNYVTGYENEEKLVAEAKKSAIKFDIDGKVKTKYFRAALMREVLYSMEDKETVVAKMYYSLKEGEAYLVITDFLFDEDTESEELTAWKEVQPNLVYPWSAESLKSSLVSYGVLVRVTEDESERYLEMMRGGRWARYLNEIIGKSVSEAFGSRLVHEAQY